MWQALRQPEQTSPSQLRRRWICHTCEGTPMGPPEWPRVALVQWEWRGEEGARAITQARKAIADKKNSSPRHLLPPPEHFSLLFLSRTSLYLRSLFFLSWIVRLPPDVSPLSPFDFLFHKTSSLSATVVKSFAALINPRLRKKKQQRPKRHLEQKFSTILQSSSLLAGLPNTQNSPFGFTIEHRLRI